MKRLVELFFEDHRWFIGISAFLLIAGLFIWCLIDYASFAAKMNGFLNFALQFAELAIAIIFIILLIKHGFSGSKKGGSGHH